MYKQFYCHLLVLKNFIFPPTKKMFHTVLILMYKTGGGGGHRGGHRKLQKKTRIERIRPLKSDL